MYKSTLVLLLVSLNSYAQERSFTPSGSSQSIEAPKPNETIVVPVTPAPSRTDESKQAIENNHSNEGQKNETKWRFGFGLGYSSNTKQTFDKVKLTDNFGTSTGTLTYDWESVPEITFSLIKSANNSWGRSVSFTYVTQQKLTGANYTVDGGSSGSIVITDPAKSESYILDGNLFYRWDSFYIPFGLNYSSHKYTLPSSSTGYTVDVKGGLGAQLGVGFFIDNKFSIEVKSRALNYNLSFAKPTANNYRGEFGSSYLSSINLTFKYITD